MEFYGGSEFVVPKGLRSTTVDFLRKHSIPQPVLDCVAQHHEDEPFSSSEAVLVYIADAISGSRPGARYEDYEEYMARLGKLELLLILKR